MKTKTNTKKTAVAKTSKSDIIRACFKKQTKVTLDVLLKKTGWNGHVLHSAMAVLRSRTKLPESRLNTKYDRATKTYILIAAKK